MAVPCTVVYVGDFPCLSLLGVLCCLMAFLPFSPEDLCPFELCGATRGSLIHGLL